MPSTAFVTAVALIAIGTLVLLSAIPIGSKDGKRPRRASIASRLAFGGVLVLTGLAGALPPQGSTAVLAEVVNWIHMPARVGIEQAGLPVRGSMEHAVAPTAAFCYSALAFVVFSLVPGSRKKPRVHHA